MDEVLIEQEVALSSIKRALQSLKKRPPEEVTIAHIEGRRKQLEQQWKHCQKLHVKINILAGSSDKSLITYFSTNEFENVEDEYLKTLDYYNEKIATLNKEQNTRSTNTTSTSSLSSTSRIVKLPRIDLPKFNGDYLGWNTFRDLFRSLIASDDTLPDVQKMHYLKSSLEGEAAQLIKHMCISAENYASAWATLSSRYEMKRVIINSYLNSFMSIPVITQETVEDLKKLRDTTAEAIQGLKNLNREIQDDLLVFVTVQKLGQPSLIEWEKYLGNQTEFPTYKDLDDFLTLRIRTLEALQIVKESKKTTNKSNYVQNKAFNRGPSTVKAYNISISNPQCLLCDNKHALYRCDKFKALTIIDRKNLVKENNLCFNCLRGGHKVQKCKSNSLCKECQRRHHTMLHLKQFGNNGTEINKSPKTEIQSSKISKSQVLNTHLESTPDNQRREVLLATAQVLVRNTNGSEAVVRVLLDQGSEATFISENLAQLLHAKRYPQLINIETIGNVPIGRAKSNVKLIISSVRNPQDSLMISALVLPRINNYQLPKGINFTDYDQLQGLELADPEPTKRGEIEMLIGADYYGYLLLEGLCRGPMNSFTAQATILGWIVSGPVNSSRQVKEIVKKVQHFITLTDLQLELDKFWDLEEAPKKTLLTIDEQKCEDHFSTTHTRLADGRYQVRLPFNNENKSVLGSSLDTAIASLLKIERRLEKDVKLQQEYHNFLREYIELNHMTEITEDNFNTDSNHIVYLPHFPIIRENSETTRVRVVFNASSRTSTGTSLNDRLLPGPKLQNDILSIMLRWRQHQFVMTADISKMFRQILLDPRDTDYQRILFRFDSNTAIKHYKLRTVTYGMTSSPFLAMRVLKQLASDEGLKYPNAKLILEKDFYVDDVLLGDDNIEKVNDHKTELIELLKKGGFTLAKWSYNFNLRENLYGRKQNNDPINLTQMGSGNRAVLGLLWCPESDRFQISIFKETHKIITKRIILSLISRLFDPMGWVNPVIITAKILMQEIWIRKLEWDEILPVDLLRRWETYYNDLNNINNLHISRWTGLTKKCNYEIHGFADASEMAYAGAVYLKVLNENDNPCITLLLAKSKVAPLKNKLTIPKLELCAVVLLSKLLQKTAEELDINLREIKIYGWTDSMVVLGWLSKHPSTWPTFVANRVAEVNSLVPFVKWRYVPSKENPSDCASRGIAPKELISHPLWWEGPVWLRATEQEWPKNKIEIPKNGKENVKNTCNMVRMGPEISSFEQILTKASSWPKLLRVTAYVFRFINNCRKKGMRQTDITLNTDEIQRSRIFWLLFVQKQHFSEEFKDLETSNNVRRTSRLKTLCPFVDKDGLLRVAGRLEKSGIPWDSKHPIILPNNHLAKLVIEQTHLRTLHGGIKFTLFILRQNFWVLRAKNTVRTVIHNCVNCTRQRAEIPSQRMGDLPSVKITQLRCFSHTGVDYAGPIALRLGKGRGRTSQKGYICIFVCMATRAIHLEVVSDYTSSGFLAAFTRFVSRRSLPSDLYSDNGPNFHGANRELQNAFKVVSKSQDVKNDILKRNIKWHFNPPSAPHFGGMWEAGVKSVKYHLRRIIGSHTLTFEELSTLLCEIEACLNSRPIGALSNDPEDYSYLSPGHFLTGTLLLAIPEPSILHINENRLTRWQLIKRKTEQFWKRWSIEYPQSLQHRYKWAQINKNFKVGDLVLIRDTNTPKTKWKLGRVKVCHPGKDGLVRVVTIKTAASEYQRPITQLCQLPVNNEIDNGD